MKDESNPAPAEPAAPLQEERLFGTLAGPRCPVCGHATVRNAACFRCLNCGTSLGCS